MRRLLTLVLLAAFMLPIAAPLLALAQDPDAGLPACCRRHGAHHCTMLTARQPGRDRAPRIGAVCPQFPQHSLAAFARTTFVSVTERRPDAHVQMCLHMPRAEDLPQRTTPANAHPKRGPPATML